VSACDTCRDPGACCAGFLLNGGPPYPYDGSLSWWTIHEEDGPLAPLVKMAQMWLPFVPMTKTTTRYDDDGGVYEINLWGCPLLGEDGRCTDYANRPELCDHYEPKSDALCAEFDWAAFAKSYDAATVSA
jgi:hypothetical protein